METKDFALLELKAISDEGIAEGYASKWGGPPDSYGDIIVKGAFADSLLTREPAFLWQHKVDTPIGGVLELREDDQGLYGKWQVDLDTPSGDYAFKMMKRGRVRGLSIGFITKEADYGEDDTRFIKKLDLYEISSVTIPAKDTAILTAVKTNVPFTQLLEQAAEVLRTVAREAQALHDRRAAANRARPLNDQHTQAIEDYLAEAKALHEGLSALVVAGTEAKAPDFREIEEQLAAARQRYYGHVLRESA